MDFWETPAPLLMMPYFPLGNLEDQHEDSPIAVEEAINLLFQVLEVLAYLHPRGVMHRDIKPANILVDSHNPLSIKVSDFGLAKDTSNLKTFCGTPLYSAPEIYWGKCTTAMDLWPLGAMVLEYAYGLKQLKRSRKDNDKRAMNEWGLSWCQYIIKQADEWDSDSDPLISLLRTGILKMNPKERLSAGQCLKRANDPKLSDSRTFGSATPILQTAPLSEVSHDNVSTTIILGALLNPAEASGCENNRRTQVSSLGQASERRGSNSIQAPVELRTAKVLSASRYEDRCSIRSGSPEITSEHWDGNSMQARVGF